MTGSVDATMTVSVELAERLYDAGKAQFYFVFERGAKRQRRQRRGSPSPGNARGILPRALSTLLNARGTRGTRKSATRQVAHWRRDGVAREPTIIKVCGPKSDALAP